MPAQHTPMTENSSLLLVESSARAEAEEGLVPKRTTVSKLTHSCRHWPLSWTVAAGVTAVTILNILIVLAMRRDRVDLSTHFFHNSQHLDKPSTRSKYKRVQGLGFQIYTGAAPAFLGKSNKDGSRVKNPECVGRDAYGQLVGETSPLWQCYMGHDDPVQDIRNRMQIMEEAVDRAFEESDKDPETLKVFIAPEFYWRGIRGSYMFEDENADDPSICGPICLLLKGLEDMVAQQRFENWIFLMGTVIASEELPTEDPYDFLFYNFSPIYKGYDPATMGPKGKRFLSPKRYVSSSDFLTPVRHMNSTIAKELTGEDLPEHDQTVFNPHDYDRRRYDNSMWDKYREELNGLGYALIEYGWMMVDGLSVSVEICFDHQMHTALNTYLADITTGRHTLIPSSSDNGLDYVHIPEYQAQVSIVSSAGMTVVPESMVLANKGVIFLQDGLSNETNKMYWGVDGCELGLQFDGGTEAIQRRAFLSATDIFFEHTALQNFQRVDVFEDWERVVAGSFSAHVYKPQVTIFDPVPIAEVHLIR